MNHLLLVPLKMRRRDFEDSSWIVNDETDEGTKLLSKYLQPDCQHMKHPEQTFLNLEQ